MKPLKRFLPEGGGVSYQHPDNPLAFTKGDTDSDAIQIMRMVERKMGLRQAEQPEILFRVERVV